MGTQLTIDQLVADAKRQSQERFREKVASAAQVSQKTAAATAPVARLDNLDPDALLALSKIARTLALKMKTAEDTLGVEGTGEPYVVAPSPTQEVEHQGSPAVVSPGKNLLSIPTTTSDKHPGTNLPATETPEQVSPEKEASAVVRGVHARYQRALAAMRKSAGEQADEVSNTDTIVGGDKPESRPDGISLPEGIPSSPEEVAAMTRQDAYDRALGEAGKLTLPGTEAAAKETGIEQLNQLVDEAKITETKAAAFRAFVFGLDPNSKVAHLIRHRLAQKTAQVAPLVPPTQPVSLVGKEEVGGALEGNEAVQNSADAAAAAGRESAAGGDVPPTGGAEGRTRRSLAGPLDESLLAPVVPTGGS